MQSFNRGISPEFVDTLNAEYDLNTWWQPLSTDQDLFVAVRADYLNVYWKGCNLLKLSLDRNQHLLGELHYKYLLQPNMKSPYVFVRDGSTQLDTAKDFFLNDIRDVMALKRAARPYVNEEKAGVHEIIKSNKNIIDVEVAFSEETANDSNPSSQRIDFAVIWPKTDCAKIVFYEAKHFANSDLRAATGVPRVVGQIQGYQKLIDANQYAIIESYWKVLANLIRLKGVFGRYQGALLESMREVAAKNLPIQIDDAVRLVIFGYDEAQRDGGNWPRHRAELVEALGASNVILRGSPNKLTLPRL